MIDFNGLSIPEAVKLIRSKFPEKFDVIIPDTDNPMGGWTVPSPDMIHVHLSLRNVTYGEIFEAMDELFNAQKTPFYWRLMNNGRAQRLP